MKDIRQKIQNHLKISIAKNRENDDLVDTGIELETNEGENKKIKHF